MTEHLERFLEEKQAERDLKHAQEKKRQERIAEIEQAPQVRLYEFWCDECQEDYIAEAHKHSNRYGYDLTFGTPYEIETPQAWYTSKCTKGHENVRRITDKLNDPYYARSMKVRREVMEHADDFLTPDDPRFKIVYPDKWREYEKQREEYEQSRLG